MAVVDLIVPARIPDRRRIALAAAILVGAEVAVEGRR